MIIHPQIVSRSKRLIIVKLFDHKRCVLSGNNIHCGPAGPQHNIELCIFKYLMHVVLMTKPTCKRD